MTHVMICEGFADGNRCGCEGQYLKTYDPEAHEGRGAATWTDKLAEARVFATAGDLLECWREQSKTRPLREDGCPNRPLTAFSVSTFKKTDGGNG